MTPREELILLEGLENNSFNKVQELKALEALEENSDDVSDLMRSIKGSSSRNTKSFEEKVKERRGTDEQFFDYKTGAKGGLRAKLSFMETLEEKENFLRNRVGEDGYTKDSKGRLALTEVGQAKEGMKSIGKNLIIDEEGFSLRDISDFAGIAPEAILGTIGGVLGGTAGSVVPFAGTAAGSAIGGGAGAAAGQAIEEGIESLLGLQKQTVGEVAKDVAIEGAIGAGASLIGDAVIGAGKKVFGVVSRKGTPLQALDAEKLTQAERLVKADALPSLEAVGASKPLAYTQKFYEGASKMEDRVLANTNYALKQKELLIAKYGGASLEETGESVLNVATKKYDDLIKNQKVAEQSALKAIDDSLDLIESSAVKEFDINDGTLGRITNAFENFSDVSAVNFKGIDDILNSIKTPVTVGGEQVTKTGKNIKVFKTDRLTTQIDDLIEEAGALESLKQETRDIVTAIKSLGDRASFSQISRTRKSINDYLFSPEVTPTVRLELNSLRNTLDDMLANAEISIPKGVILTSKQKKALKAAANQRKTAMDNYREGLKRFEALEKHGLIRSIRAATKEPEFTVDKFFSRIVEPNSPERLKAILKAVDEPEALRSELSRKFLDDAMLKTKGELGDVNKFNGTTFYNSVQKLGTTGKELFGNKYGEVQRLAKALAYNGVKNLDEDVMQRIIAANPSGDIIPTLQSLNKANIEATEAFKSKILRDLQKGDLSADDAVLAMSKPTATNNEIKQIKQFFGEGSETLEKIKKRTMEEILSPVDDTVFDAVGTAKALQDNLNKYKNGVLKELLGEDGEAALKQLASDLVVLGDVSKEGAIAAAGLSAAPIKNFPKLLRMKLTAKFLADKDNLLRYIEIQKNLNSSGAKSTQVATGQLITEIAGKDASDQASKTLSKAGNIFNKVRTGLRVKDQALPRMFLEQINQRPERSSSLSDVSVFNTPTRKHTGSKTTSCSSQNKTFKSY